MFSKWGYAVAGVAAAAAIAVPLAAVGTSGGTATPKTPTGSAARTAPKPPAKSVGSDAGDFATIAHRAGISVAQLQRGLVAAKRAGGNTSAAVAAFARATGVPRATAEQVVTAVFGSQGTSQGVSPGAMSAALAHQLGVNDAAAARAMREIDALSTGNGVDPHSAGFAAVARQLGVSPARLMAALDHAKMSLAGH
jgi:hypothetical protein